MFPQLYNGASGMMASERTLDLVANNLANVRTPGYAPDRPLFASYLDESLTADGDPAKGGSRQVTLAGSWRSDTPGPMNATGGALDLAIQGPGYFRLETPAGERLTRAGAMKVLADGTLSSADGHPLLDTQGQRIVLPKGNPAVGIDGTVTVSLTEDGRLTGTDEVVAQIGLAKGSVNAMIREGEAMWRPAGAVVPLPEGEATISPGFLEQSGVQPTRELVNMIEAQRLFEMQQRVVNVTANTVMKRALDLAGVR